MGRLVDALLVELSNTPSKLAERSDIASKLLAPESRVFAYLAEDKTETVGAMLISERAEQLKASRRL